MPERRPTVSETQKAAEIRVLESKIDLIVQKIRTIEKNEEVIGRTLVTQNEKLKKLEQAVESGGAGGGASSEELEKQVAVLKQEFASKQDLQELRYILEQINPLEFARIDQVKEFIDERVDEAVDELLSKKMKELLAKKK